jgi:hypothetical protein
MSNSILVGKSLVGVVGAIVMVAGSASAMACPPEEGSVQVREGVQLGVPVRVVPMLRDVPMVVQGRLLEVPGHEVRTVTGVPILRELPLVVQGLAWQPESQSLTVITQSDGTDTYKVTIKDGTVSAEVNGKALSDDRIRRKGEKIELLDKDGDVVATFHTPGVTEPARNVRGRSRALSGTFTPLARTAPGGMNVVVGQQIEPPPVMLGITMSEDPDQDTDGVTLTSVLSGLPAEQAGLKAGDRVIEMDGQRIKGQGDLRSVIRSKKAGEELKVKVAREGEEKEITVQLEAFSAERMKDAGAPQWWERMQQGQGSHESKWDEARQQIERALEQVRSNPNLNTEKMKEKAVAALEKALKSLEESKSRMQTEIRAWAADPNRGGMIFGDRPQQLFVTPAPSVPAAPQNDAAVLRRMERIADSLERLDKRLDEIEKRLNEREQGSKPQR